MSHRLLSHNDDLKRLRDEGYEVEITSNGFLTISHVPYVNAKPEVVNGTLVSRLELAGDKTVKPGDHVALWVGDYPCDHKGSQLSKIVNNASLHEQIKEGLVATHSFSQKPTGGYKDYYDKMTSYIRMLEGEARALDPNAKSQTFPVIQLTEDESVFCYLDTASSRAGITAITEKLKKGLIGIVGLGGTGAYILDLVAKTPVAEIHLFDGDTFLQHNAFRYPGAPSSDDLARKPSKVEWLSQIYSKMRRKIIPHNQYVDETNVAELKPMDFVFLCIDKGGPRKMIENYLLENKIPFIDVGIGLNIRDESLAGLVRVTTCTPDFHDHAAKRISFSDDENNLYSLNVQIADMNALNAALAVIKWKKLWSFYADMEKEHDSVYGIPMNIITNGESGNEAKDAHT